MALTDLQRLNIQMKPITAEVFIHALIISCPLYYNSLFSGLPSFQVFSMCRILHPTFFQVQRTCISPVLFPLGLVCSGTLFKTLFFLFNLSLIHFSLVNIDTSLLQPLSQTFCPAGTHPHEPIFNSVEVELDPLVP